MTLRVTVKQSDIDKLTKQIKQNIVKIRQVALPKIAKEAIKLIKGETRSGFRMENEKGKSRFPSLAPSTVNSRNLLRKNNATHPTFSPGRSNVTFSGQLVDAIDFKIKRNGEIDLFIKTTRREAYKKKDGTKQKTKGLTNAKLYTFLAPRGFDFLQLDAKSLDQLGRILRREVLKNLRI